MCCTSLLESATTSALLVSYIQVWFQSELNSYDRTVLQNLPCILALTHNFTACAVVFLIFTVPKLYELRKHEIDSVANQVVSQSKQAYSQYGAPYVNKIPRASTSTSTSNVNRPVDNYSTADSASIAPNGPNEYKKTY